MVFYVVAHEMGHQWWGHQVVGANMQGATSLVETLAQYSALMTMEKEYGRDTMRKFLQYEMDNYLRARGAELLKERPLLRVEASQGYIHYRKGSVVMYYLREMIGEEAVNRALRKVLNKYGYAAAAVSHVVRAGGCAARAKLRRNCNTSSRTCSMTSRCFPTAL